MNNSLHTRFAGVGIGSWWPKAAPDAVEFGSPIGGASREVSYGVENTGLACFGNVDIRHPEDMRTSAGLPDGGCG